MVVQRAPSQSSVYGLVDDSVPSKVVVTVSGSGSSYDIDEIVTEKQWKAILRATPTGGNYIIAVKCSNCANTTEQAIDDVTFGDVWYCAGQSNMWLPL
jgi:hypothetical protein